MDPKNTPNCIEVSKYRVSVRKQLIERRSRKYLWNHLQTDTQYEKMEGKCGFCLFLGTILHKNGQKNVKKRKKNVFQKVSILRDGPFKLYVTLEGGRVRDNFTKWYKGDTWHFLAIFELFFSKRQNVTPHGARGIWGGKGPKISQKSVTYYLNVPRGDFLMIRIKCFRPAVNFINIICARFSYKFFAKAKT
jgi:hypothetical protein